MPFTEAVGKLAKYSATELEAIIKALRERNVVRGLPTEVETGPYRGEVARRNAVEMLGLPEWNTALDRALAQGFDLDKVLYHGMSGEMQGEGFIPAFGGQRSGRYKMGNLGVWSAPNPAVAQEFASLSSQGRSLAGTGDPSRVLGTDAVLPLFLRASNVGKVRIPPGALPDELARTVQNSLNNPRVDALHLTNYTTPKGLSQQETYVVGNPAQLRSRFAQFDPARINENDLLASVAPYMAAGTALAGASALTPSAAEAAEVARIRAEDKPLETPSIDPVGMFQAALTGGGSLAARGVQAALDPAVNYASEQLLEPVTSRIAKGLLYLQGLPQPQYSTPDAPTFSY